MMLFTSDTSFSLYGNDLLLKVEPLTVKRFLSKSPRLTGEGVVTPPN